MNKIIAQTDLGNIQGVGALNNITRTATGYPSAFLLFERVISNVLALLTIIGSLYFMVQIIMSGYNYISAAGDKALVQAAQKKLSNSFMGLFIVVLAYLITGLVGRFVGLDIFAFHLSIATLNPSLP